MRSVKMLKATDGMKTTSSGELIHWSVVLSDLQVNSRTERVEPIGRYRLAVKRI